LPLTHFLYESLTVVLSKVVEDQVHQLLNEKNNINYRIFDKNNRYGNAVVAFEINGHMFSFLEISLTYKWRNPMQYDVKFADLAVLVSAAKLIAPQLWEDDLTFGVDHRLRLSLTCLDDKQIDATISSAVAACFEHAAVNMENINGPEVCR
jgi:hypothetical protein